MNSQIIKNYKRYTKKPNTITGSVFTATINIDKLKYEKDRLIRIFLPSDYIEDDEKRFPVIYMMDGKNLFDKHTSFAGEWGVDEIIEERIKNQKQSYIIVGIDSSVDGDLRCQEMAPSGINLTSIDGLPNSFDAYGDILGEYIVNILIPEIDRLFKTNGKNTIAGSSMGGLFAYYMGMKYHFIFESSICFSPAFCLYDNNYFKQQLNQITLNNEYFYLLVGDVEYENQFVELTKYTYEFMKEKGFKHIKYVHDFEGIHHESFWNKYFSDALKFIEKED